MKWSLSNGHGSWPRDLLRVPRVTKAKEVWVGCVITHYVGWSNSYDQSGYLESRHNVPEKGNRKCCVYKVLIIAILVIFSMQWAALYSKRIPCNINNRYLSFNALFCTCQVCMSQLYNPQLQGRLTKAVFKKACQNRTQIWLAVVFAELWGFHWQSWHFFTGLCGRQSELPAVVVCRGHV